MSTNFQSSITSSIDDSSFGILETYVTWEDVERRMREALHTSAKFGPNKSVMHIGERNGFMSRIGLITCDWINMKEGEVLPRRFAIKIASGLPSQGFKLSAEPIGAPKADVTAWLKEDMIREVHNLEVGVYDFVRGMKEKVAMPKCYYSVPFNAQNPNAGCIALEYLGNTKVNHAYNNLTVDQMRQIARHLGKIQALSVVHGIDKVTQLDLKELLRDFCFNENMITLSISAFKRVAPTMIEAVDGVLKIFPEYVGTNLTSSIITQMGVKPVLVHGDLWPGNILVDCENGEVKALIDWQTGHQGSGVEDLIRIMFNGLSSQTRRENMKSLLEEMYTTMETNLGSIPAPYTREEMHEMADHLFPHCGFFFLAPGKMMLKLMSSPGLNDEEKDRRKSILLDKIRGVCEDIVVYHEKNKQSIRRFKFNYV